MKFSFTGISKVTLQHNKGQTTSQHVSTDIRLDPSSNLDARLYLEKGLPTKEGAKPLTQAFIQGLVANVHRAHELNHWDSAEHLRYINKEIERGVFTVAEVSKGEMTIKDPEPGEAGFLSPISNEEEYQKALKQLDKIYDSAKGTSEYAIAEALETLIEQYESNE